MTAIKEKEKGKQRKAKEAEERKKLREEKKKEKEEKKKENDEEKKEKKDDDVAIHQLENKVIDIANKIDVTLRKSDFEACHRLKKKINEKSSRTITRFVNRKLYDKLHQNKKKLGLQEVKKKLSETGIQEKSSLIAILHRIQNLYGVNVKNLSMKNC